MWSRYEEQIRWYGQECTHRDGVLYLLTGIAYFYIHDDGGLRATVQNPKVLKPAHNPYHVGIVIPNSLSGLQVVVFPPRLSGILQ